MKYILKLAIKIIEKRVNAYDSRQARAISELPDDSRFDNAVCILEEKTVRLSEACQLLKSELTGGTA
jgi:hypothetical protein